MLSKRIEKAIDPSNIKDPRKNNIFTRTVIKEYLKQK